MAQPPATCRATQRDAHFVGLEVYRLTGPHVPRDYRATYEILSDRKTYMGAQLVKQPCGWASVEVWLQQEEGDMRGGLICAAVGLALATTMAQAPTDNDKDAQHTAALPRARP